MEMPPRELAQRLKLPPGVRVHAAPVVSKADVVHEEDGCTCGHVRDEHGGDPKHPSSTKCNIEGCDCLAFEANL